MKKRILNLILIILLFIPTFLFVGCFGMRTGNNQNQKAKVNLASDKVRIEILGSYYYTGEPLEVHSSNLRIYIDETNNYLNPAQLTLVYANNIEVGTADLIITAKEESRYVYGTVTTHFEIQPNYKQGVAENFQQAKEMLDGNYYRYVRINDDFEIPNGETLTIPNGKSLTFTGAWSRYKNYGTIIISENAVVNMGNTSENWFFNYGTITTNNKMTLVGRCYTFNSGEINGQISASSSAKIYTNSQISLSENTPTDIVTIRKNLADTIVAVSLDVDENNNYRYVKDGEKPAFIVDGTRIEYDADKWGGAALKPSYSEADDLGTATATLVASDDNKQYFGQITKEFNIVKGRIEFANYQEFVEFQDSGLYDEYVSADGVGITDDFTLNSGETLLVSSNTIYKNFINNGTIKPKKGTTLSVSATGRLENYGSILPNEDHNISIDVNGKFLNGSDTKSATLQIDALDIKNNNTVAGSFENYGDVLIDLVIWVGRSNSDDLIELINHGTISSSGKSLWCYGQIKNYGEINGFYLHNYKSITNYGGARFLTKNVNFYLNGSLVNKENATFIFGENLQNKTRIERINITNAGAIVNKSTMDILDSYTTFENTGSIDNTDGYIWTFRQPDGNSIDNTNLTIIKRLSESEILLNGVANLEYTYDNNAHVPSSFTVDGETLNSGDYSVTKAYRAGIGYENNDKNFTSTGVVKYTISIKNFHNNSTTYTYGGSVDVNYIINYGTTTTGNDDFASTIRNRNWGTIILSENVVYQGWDIELEKHQTIDTNGHTLSINTNYDTYPEYDYYAFTNNGKIIVRQVGTGELAEENCGLKVYGTKVNQKIYRSNFKHYGTIQNEGIIYVSDVGGMMAYSLSAAITGNGKIFTWDHSPLVNLNMGGNLVYTRASLTADKISLSQTEFDYDGSEKRPIVTVYKNNAPVESEFVVTYQDNINAGNAKAIVKPDAFNPDYVCTVEKEFIINKIVGYINSTTIHASSLDNQNHYKYVVQNSSNQIRLYENLTIPDNLILDIGTCRFNENYYSVTLDQNSELHVSVSTFEDLQKYVYIADKITLTADITDTTTLNYRCYNYNIPDSSFFINEHLYSLEIDFNGHSFAGTTSIYFDTSRDITTNVSLISSGSMSQIGSISVQSGNASSDGAVYVNLDNLNAGDISISGISSNNVNATNCVFNSTYTGSAGASALNIQGYEQYTTTHWENCVFNGKTAIWMYGGTNTFVNCAMNSTGTYSSGMNYGNGVVIKQDGGRWPNVTFERCSIKSQNGYGIRTIGTRYTLNIDNATTIQAPMGNTYHTDS